MQGKGEVKRFEQEFPTTWPKLQEARAWAYSYASLADRKLSPETFRYTIESTGTYHLPVLLSWRGVPSVVNPMLAGPTRRKTDVLDARMLAHHSITGMWRASFIPEEKAEILRILLNMRYEATRNGTRALNRINNHVLRFGHTFGREFSMADGYARAAIEDMCKGIVPQGEAICPDGIPAMARCFFLKSYELYDQFRELRDEYHKYALNFVKFMDWPIVGRRVGGEALLKSLMSVPGIGEVSALTWLAIVCDPNRFASPNQVSAFCGADPSLKVSAGKVTSHVKRKGNARLHHVLKNVAAQLVRRHAEPLGLWGFNIMKRHAKGGWARAINAVSRRLAILLWRVHCGCYEFSYEQYTFYLTPEVEDVSIEDMELGRRYETALKEAGLSRSTEVARAFLTSLPQQKGIGAGCLNKVKAWLDGHKLQAPKEAPAACPTTTTGSKSPATESPTEAVTPQKSARKQRRKAA